MTIDKILSLKWERPDGVEYPKVWHTFMERGLDSDQLVEYRIEDLSFEKVGEVFQHMQTNYIQDEPIEQVFGGITDPDHVEDFKMIWKQIVTQKLSLVCYRSDSDEIVGAFILYALTKEDDFLDQIYKRFKSQATKDSFDLMGILCENFDVFEHYGVEKYLTDYGLAVDRKYRGRAIGQHFFTARKLMCKEFGFKIDHTFFTSDSSNRIGDKAGYITDIAIKYKDIIKIEPRFKSIANIKSKELTRKTLICHE